jgi:hypothetical protein
MIFECVLPLLKVYAYERMALSSHLTLSLSWARYFTRIAAAAEASLLPHLLKTYYVKEKKLLDYILFSKNLPLDAAAAAAAFCVRKNQNLRALTKPEQAKGWPLHNIQKVLNKSVTFLESIKKKSNLILLKENGTLVCYLNNDAYRACINPR